VWVPPQIVEVVAPYEKQRRLEEILRTQERGAKVIIFCSTKRMCDQLVRTLDPRFGAVAIHGDKSQQERDHVLAQFRKRGLPHPGGHRRGGARPGREGHQERGQL